MADFQISLGGSFTGGNQGTIGSFDTALTIAFNSLELEGFVSTDFKASTVGVKSSYAGDIVTVGGYIGGVIPGPNNLIWGGTLGAGWDLADHLRIGPDLSLDFGYTPPVLDEYQPEPNQSGSTGCKSTSGGRCFRMAQFDQLPGLYQLSEEGGLSLATLLALKIEISLVEGVLGLDLLFGVSVGLIPEVDAAFVLAAGINTSF